MALTSPSNKPTRALLPSTAPPAECVSKPMNKSITSTRKPQELDFQNTIRACSQKQPADSPSNSATSFANMTAPPPFLYATDGTNDMKCKPRNSRPETTNVVARRMIFSALGMKMPKKTEKERAFDTAIKERAMRRRSQGKELIVREKKEADLAEAAV